MEQQIIPGRTELLDGAAIPERGFIAAGHKAAAGNHYVGLVGVPLGIVGIISRKGVGSVPFNALECKTVPGLEIDLPLFLKPCALAAIIYPDLGGGQMIDPGQRAVGDGMNAIGQGLGHVGKQPVNFQRGIGLMQGQRNGLGTVAKAPAVEMGNHDLVVLQRQQTAKGPGCAGNQRLEAHSDCSFHRFLWVRITATRKPRMAVSATDTRMPRVTILRWPEKYSTTRLKM